MITQQQIYDYLVQFIDVLIAQAKSPEAITEAFMAAGYDRGYGQRKPTLEQWSGWITSLATTTATPDAPGDFDNRSASYPTPRAKLYYGFIMGAAFIHRTSGQATILAQLPPETEYLQDAPRVLPNFLYQMLHSHAYPMVEARLAAFKNKAPLVVPFAQDPEVMSALTRMRTELITNGVNSASVQSIYANIEAVNARVKALGPLVRAYRQHVNVEQTISKALQAYRIANPQTTLNFLITTGPEALSGPMLDVYKKYIQNQLPAEQQSEVEQLFLQNAALKNHVEHLNEIEKLQHRLDSMKTLDEETQGHPEWFVAELKAFEVSSVYEAVKRQRFEETLRASQDLQEREAAQQYIHYYDAKQSLLGDCNVYERHLRDEAKKTIDIRSKKCDSVPIVANVDAELKSYKERSGRYQQGSAEMQAVGQVLNKLDQLQNYRNRVEQAKTAGDLIAIGNDLQGQTLLSAHRDTFGKAFIAKALTTIVTLGGALVYNRMKTGEFTNFASFDFGPLFASEGQKLKHKIVDTTTHLRHQSPSSPLLQSAAESNAQHPTGRRVMPEDKSVRISEVPLDPAGESNPVELLSKQPPKGILKKS